MSRVVFVDTETTGLEPMTEDVFEVAVITAAAEHVVRLRPRDHVVAVMHPRAAEVNRYHVRTVDPSWRWDDVGDALDLLRSLLDGAHVCGAVPDFDARHLTRLFRFYGQEPPRWHYHLIDVEAMALGWLIGRSQIAYGLGSPAAAMPDLPWRSDDLSRACGVEPPSGDDRHTALADARWAKRWYEAIVGDSS